MTTRAVSALVLILSVVTALAQTGAPTESHLAWLKANAVAVKTVQAGNGFEDLRTLKAAIGSARIVSLGEATHGTREIFQMKHRLTEFLATELGSRSSRSKPICRKPTGSTTTCSVGRAIQRRCSTACISGHGTRKKCSG